MELIEWEGIKASVMSPGKARLYSTILFAGLHFVPPLVKTISKVQKLVHFWVNGPNEVIEGIRTPLPSSADFSALEEDQKEEMQRKANEVAWTVWDTIETGLTLLQAIADTSLLSAAIALQYDEIVMTKTMATLRPDVATEIVADQTAIYFRARAHHRFLLDLSRKWIFTSFALDALHLSGNIAHVIYTHTYNTSSEKSIMVKEEATSKLTWRHFVRSAIIYNLVSIATNSLWYSIYVTSPTFQPKGLTSLTMKVLNNI
jgi:hypothetical protein